MRIVCGLDVHKDSIFLCIMSSTGEIFEKKYGVLTNQLEEMRDLMLTYHVQEVGMESTSVYWVPVWRILEPHFKLKLINPYFIKQLPGHKSDVKDAQWIAECMMKELVRGSFVPPERIQQLRLYDRRIYDLDDEIIRKLAKLDAAVQRCNIRLSNYVSNTDSVSYKSVIDKICEGVTSPEELVKEVHGRIINRHGRETIIASLKGCVTENKTIKSRRITHGNRYLRRTIIQCAWGASRTRGCFFSRFSYHQTQVRKKNKMKVVVAISRKMIVCAWHILREGVGYKDFDNMIFTTVTKG